MNYQYQPSQIKDMRRLLASLYALILTEQLAVNKELEEQVFNLAHELVEIEAEQDQMEDNEEFIPNTVDKLDLEEHELGKALLICRGGLTQQELSKKIGIKRVQISQLETGARTPSLSTLLSYSSIIERIVIEDGGVRFIMEMDEARTRLAKG